MDKLNILVTGGARPQRLCKVVLRVGRADKKKVYWCNVEVLK